MGLTSRTDPGKDFDAYTPSDSANFPGGLSREIRVASGGDIQFVLPDGTVKEWPSANCPDGTVISLEAIRINATDTTASDIVVVY